MTTFARRTRTSTIALAAGLLASLPTGVLGQRIETGARAQSFEVNDPQAAGLKSVRLISIPWHAASNLTSWAGLSVDGAVARASVSVPNGESSSVDGFTDTQVSLAVARNRLALTLAAILPAGDVGSSIEEATVVGLLASDLFPFAVTRWGSGFGVGGDLAYDVRLGPATVGVAVGYSSVAGFAPLEGIAATYTPGGQTRLRGVIEWEFGTAGVLSVLGGFQRFGADAFDGRSVMTAGDRVEGVISLFLPVGARESVMIYGGVYQRGEGRLGKSSGRPAPIEVLLPGSATPVSRALFVAGTEARVGRGRLDVAPRGEVRILRSAAGLGQGWLASVEVGADYRLFGERFGSKLVLQPSGAMRLGEIIPERDSESRVLGWEAGLMLRWETGP